MTLSRRPRLVRAVAVSACVLGVGLVGAQPSAARTFACSTPSEPAGLNGGYFSNLRVSGYRSRSTACRRGRSLVLAYYRCRRARGVRGSCHGRRVNGLRCRERRGDVIATEFNATVTCRRGSRRIVHVYQQNT